MMVQAFFFLCMASATRCGSLGLAALFFALDPFFFSAMLFFVFFMNSSIQSVTCSKQSQTKQVLPRFFCNLRFLLPGSLASIRRHPHKVTFSGIPQGSSLSNGGRRQ